MRQLFDVTKPQIIELIAKIKESSETASKDIYGNVFYPEEKQAELTKNMTSTLGYNFGSGLMVKTKRHPETYAIGAHDVRISIRYEEHNPKEAILVALHEGGHGIAAQGIPDEYYEMPIGTYPGMSMAEAESKLFENNIGRSRAF